MNANQTKYLAETEVWKGSWIVPSLEPITASSSSSSARKAPMKKASLDNRQQTTFQGRDGVKLQPVVTELTGITLAISNPRPQPTTPPAASSTLATEERQFMKENTEMHLVAKIRLSTFPIFLLMPGCTEPCRVFTAPESTASAQFLQDLFDQDDVDAMKTRCREGDGTAVGQIGLLLRVATKSGSNNKKKSVFSSHSRHDDNPFLQSPGTQSSGLSKSGSAESTDDPRRKLYHDTTMFLVYGMLADHDLDRDGNRNSRNSSDLPIMSFFAYPLVDQASFSEQMLLNTRTFERLKQDAEEVQLADPLMSMDDELEAEAYVQYQDPNVDSIMNGSGDETGEDYKSGYVSDWAAVGEMDVGKDESLRQEIELLRALERSKTWSPYTVLPPPSDTHTPSSSASNSASSTSKDIAKSRIFSRSQTLDRMAFISKETSVSARSLNSWSRHRSLDSQGAQKQTSTSASAMAAAAAASLQPTSSTASKMASSTSASKLIKKSSSRRKSPSRAPQQPLDLTTDSLRRRLLGPGSVRTELPKISNISPASTTNSIEAHNKATVEGLVESVLSGISIAKDHKDYQECAENLYRSVTFAMRKEITTRRYHLAELETLMHRHAAIL